MPAERIRCNTDIRIEAVLPMEKPTIVLVSGAWHTQAHIDPVIPFFEKAGYRIIPQTLPSAGAHVRTFEQDVAAVHATIIEELQSGHNVVLILHSLAGMVGLEAVNQIIASNEYLGGTIMKIILLASFLDATPVTAHLMENDYTRTESDRSLLFTQHAEQVFYNDMPLDKAQPFIEALTSQAMHTGGHPVLSSERWRSAAPVTYLLCNQDDAVPPAIGESTAEKYGMQLVRMDAGHCPFTSQPERFVEVVDGIVRG